MIKIVNITELNVLNTLAKEALKEKVTRNPPLPLLLLIRLTKKRKRRILIRHAPQPNAPSLTNLAIISGNSWLKCVNVASVTVSQLIKMISYQRHSWSTTDNNKSKNTKAKEEIRVVMVGVSFEIAEVKPGLMTLWFKATMKMIKGLATLNNSTIKYMKST